MQSLLLIVTLLASLTAGADTLQGRVVGIADGDTITVIDASNTQTKIRLLGIDAPEKKMPFGQRSKEHLSDLVFNNQVTVEYSKKDKYGRTVGKILIDGVDANLEQVKAGMAWHYKQYQQEQAPIERSSYADAEEQARAGRRGLWSDPNPTPPWDWRKAQKTKTGREYEKKHIKE